jgi:2-oxoglutarate dehydrogenase E2 component (dihydrolipoamide succinyltransferase)
VQHEQGDEIVYRDYVDLSVAVATPKGLVTPVIRNAESLSFVEFEKELTAIGKKACFARCALQETPKSIFLFPDG